MRTKYGQVHSRQWLKLMCVPAFEALCRSAVWLQMQRSFDTLSAFVWQNPLGFDPQTVLNGFGTEAADMFKLLNAYSGMVQAYTGTAPPSPVPAGWSYTVNADGTVTVTASPGN